MFISCQAIKSLTALSSVIALLIGSTGLAASAQPCASTSNSQNAFGGFACFSRPSTPTLNRFNGSQRESYHAVEMSSPASVPYLPAYYGQGARYTSGIYYPHLKGRQCYVMSYLAKDSSRDLVRNYRQSILQNGWQINAMQSNDYQITATRKENGLCLILHVSDRSQPGYRSSFEIKYLTTGSVQTR